MIINIKNDILSVKEDSAVNDNFKEYRRRTGMSQKEFGKAVGMPQSFIGRIENGTVNIENVSLRKGFLFASAMGIRMEELLDDKRSILDSAIIKRIKMEEQEGA